MLGPDGRGFVYDLAPARFFSGGTEWLWLDTASGPVRVGRVPGESKAISFLVRGRTAPVKGAFVTLEPGTPSAPGPVVARASFS